MILSELAAHVACQALGATVCRDRPTALTEGCLYALVGGRGRPELAKPFFRGGRSSMRSAFCQIVLGSSGPELTKVASARGLRKQICPL